MRDLPPVPELLLQMTQFPQDVASALIQPGIDWHWSPAPGEWNLTQVIYHLRDVEVEVHQPRFRSVLQTEGAFIQGLDADLWAGPRAYHLQHGPDGLSDYVIARSTTIDLLVDLTDQQWQRTCQHAFFGMTTLYELVGLALRHDMAHWEQIQALLSR